MHESRILLSIQSHYIIKNKKVDHQFTSYSQHIQQY